MTQRLVATNLVGRVSEAAQQAEDRLVAARRPDGSWVDRLSSSAIATALGALSLAEADPDQYKLRIVSAVDWLRSHQREDGGWAMADALPPSSPGMTAFGIAALHHLDAKRSHDEIERGWHFLDEADGWEVIPGLSGEAPRTWPAAAPIIWSLVGLWDPDKQPDQPVEAMLLPPRLRNKVSIGLPVVLSLGIMQRRTLRRNWLRRILGAVAEPLALNWLRKISGINGGIEECPMISGFNYLALNRAGVAPDLQMSSLRYLLETQRADGSWAIDRDLEISVTAYSIMALAQGTDFDPEAFADTREWLINAQWNKPFEDFGIPAGGWAWANPSGWPESEDTAVVLGVLAELGVPRNHPSVGLAIDWLLARQNRNGSWSEWVMNSNIMNDRPCAGVTSHVVMALAAYGEPSTPATPVGRALNYLASAQEPDGSIESVWFRDNVHGTSRLIETFATVGRVTSPVVTRARKWLLDNQADDGGWPKKFNLPPAHATAEETAWAVYSLLKGGEDPSAAAITSGIEWLVEHQNADATWTPSNVGLYFDDLCYSDDMIADTFTLRTLLLWQSAIQSAGFG